MKTIDPDTQLVLALQAGSHEAFEELYLKYHHKSLCLSTRILQSYEKAEDALQGAFLNLWKNSRSFRFESLFSTWWFKVVTNSALMYKRYDFACGPKLFRGQSPPMKAVSLSSDTEATNDFLCLPSLENPEAAVMAQEEADDLREIYQSLTKEEQQIVYHTIFMDELCHTTGKKLKLTLPAVKSRKFRAKDKMRLKWEKTGREPRGFLLPYREAV